MKKYNFFFLILSFILTSCARNEVVKSHGISYLEKRQKLIFINKSNKNDIVKIMGKPSTKGLTDDNTWIYIERTLTRGKLLKLGRNYLKKNNILVLEFNKYGILTKKDLLDKDSMNELSFAKDVTENEIRKENFIYSFLSSIRQKMETKKR